MAKIIRTSTIPLSLYLFCNGLMEELSEKYEVIAVSSPGGDLDKIAESGKFKTIPVPMNRRISPLKDLISLFRLIKVFKKEKPDIVHSMTPKAGLLTMIASKFTGVSNRVHTFTGLVFPTSSGLKKRILSLCDKITCACATHIIAEGKGVRKDLTSNKITGKKIEILGHGNMRGIDLDFFNKERVLQEANEIRKRIKADEITTVFLFVGRLVGDKGINELIRAFDRLIDEGYNVKLLLVGETEPIDPLQQETLSKINNSPDIYFQNEWIEDVRPYYAASDMLVLPSYREGFPNVVLEAGAMELPSIVTDVNGSREIISNGENGFIIPIKDDEALYNEMKKIAFSKDRFKEMGVRARKNISYHFEKSYVRGCHKEFYRRLIG